MLFPFFFKNFTDILKIYELPKVYNKIPKYSKKKTLVLLNNNNLPIQFCAPTAPSFSAIPLNCIENVP